MWTNHLLYTSLKMSQIVSQQVFQRHSVSNAPKIIQVVYSNGRVVNVHKHNNGSTTYKTIREGTSVVQFVLVHTIKTSYSFYCDKKLVKNG